MGEPPNAIINVTNWIWRRLSIIFSRRFTTEISFTIAESMPNLSSRGCNTEVLCTLPRDLRWLRTISASPRTPPSVQSSSPTSPGTPAPNKESPTRCVHKLNFSYPIFSCTGSVWSPLLRVDLQHVHFSSWQSCMLVDKIIYSTMNPSLTVRLFGRLI